MRQLNLPFRTRLFAAALTLTLIATLGFVVTRDNTAPTGDLLVALTPVAVTGTDGPITIDDAKPAKIAVLPLLPLTETIAGVIFDLDVDNGSGAVTVSNCTDTPALPDLFLPHNAGITQTVFTTLSADGSVCITADSRATVTLTARGYIPDNSAVTLFPKRDVTRELDLPANRPTPVSVAPNVGNGSAIVQLVTRSTTDHTVNVTACSDMQPAVPIDAPAGRASSSQLILGLDPTGNICLTANQPTTVDVAVTATIAEPLHPHILPTGTITGDNLNTRFAPAPRLDARFVDTQVHAGQPTTLTVDLFAQDIPHGEELTVHITVPASTTITHTSDGFRCTTTHPELTCTRYSTNWPKSLHVTLDTAHAAPGLHGATAEILFGTANQHPSPWDAATSNASIDIALLNILAPLNQHPAMTATSLTVTATPPSLPTHSTAVIAPTTPTRATSTPAVPSATTEPTAEFCTLLTALGKPNDEVTIGPVKFWNLTDATANQTDCNPLSQLTLRHVNITIGPVTFEKVTAIATPSSLTFTSTLAGTNIELAISGGFPAPNVTAIGAAVTFDVGTSRMTVRGELDYTNQDTFTISLTSADSGWQPLPGLAVDQSSITGSYTRTKDRETFTVQLGFTGRWQVSSDVTVSGVTAGLTLSEGVVGVVLGASLDGTVAVGDVTLPLPQRVTGTLNEDGVTSLSVALQPFTIADVVKFDPFIATFTYYPDGPLDTDEEFSLAGTATFIGEYSQFFTASTTGKISVRADGTVLTAAMNVMPTGYTGNLGSLLFTYAMPDNPDLAMLFTLPGGNPNVQIPLPSGVPVATVPFGVPEQLTRNQDFTLLNNVGTGVASVSLNPSEPGYTVYYEPPSNTFLFGTATTTPRAEFDDIFLSVSMGIDERFAIGGQVTLTLADGTTLELIAELDTIISETGFAIDGQLTLAADDGWRDPFGMNGVTLDQLSIDVGISDLLPSLGLLAVASLPSELTNPLGVDPRSIITVGAELAAADPCLIFDISPPASQPNLNVLNIADGALTATNAELVAAPFGCAFGNLTYPSGFRLAFDGAVEDVTTTFDATFTLAPFSFNATGDIGTFTLDGITFTETTANLAIGLTGVSFGLTVGIDANGSLEGTGTVLLTQTGGFVLDGSGSILIDGSRSDVTISATNCQDSSCSTLVTPSFFAAGEINTRGFTFQASIGVTGSGAFDATLTIPNNTYRFRISQSNYRTDVTVHFGLKLVVSNHSDSVFTVDAGAGLSHCQAKVAGIWWDCPKGSVSTHTTIKTSELDFNVKYSANVAGAKVSGSGTGRLKT